MRRSRKMLQFIGLGALLIYSVIFTIIPRFEEIENRRSGCDFDDFYFASLSGIVHRNSIFDLSSMQGLAFGASSHCLLPIYYQPPLSTLVFAPLLFLDLRLSHYVWLFLSILFMYLIVGLVGKNVDKSPLSWTVMGAWLFILAFSNPLKDHLWQGQTNLFCLLLIIVGSSLQTNSKPMSQWIAAFFIAFAMHNKPFMAIVGLGFLASGCYGFCVRIAIAAASLMAISLTFFLLSDYQMYPQHVLHSMYFANASISANGNYAIQTAINRWLFNGEKNIFSVIVCGCLIACYGWSCYRLRHHRENKSYLSMRIYQNLVLIAFVMGSIWRHHLVLYLPLMMACVIHLIPHLKEGKKFAKALVPFLGFSIFFLSCFLGEPMAQVIATFVLLVCSEGIIRLQWPRPLANPNVGI